MRKMIAMAILMTSTAGFACSENLKNHPDECLLQERFQRMKTDFAKLSIKVEQISGYALSRALGPGSLSSFKSKSSHVNPAEIYQHPDWQKWQNGQKFINSLSSVYLNHHDILKLHKSVFSAKSTLGNLGTDAGKLRISMGITNPRENFSCQDKVITEETLTYIADPDLRSDENYPLLEIENVSACPEMKGIYSATLIYYKGASMKEELTRWLNDFNDMLIRFEKGTASADLSPVSYMADMRRWFLAIAPFAYGNLEVANALSDYFMKRLELMPLPLKDLKSTHLLELEDNRELIKKRTKETLSFIEGCLFENKIRPVSTDCSSL